ncbi:hypothetical protein AAG906_027258 [Vitis piasezkii]
MASLLYFEEKVHRKKLQRDDTIPLLLPRLLFHILEYMGYPTEPHFKRHHHCQEQFTLDKWTQLDELPTEFVPPAPTTLMPEATYTTSPTTSVVPPDAPSTSEASISISAIEFCAMTSPPPQRHFGPSEPIASAEETIRVDVLIQATQEATIEASSSHDPTTT